MLERIIKDYKTKFSKFIPEIINRRRSQHYEAKRHNKYKNMPLEEIFDTIYKNNDWGEGKNSYYSGIGSNDKEIIEPYIKAVNKYVSSLSDKPVIIDIGSGDFNVSKHLVKNAKYYYACDIVKDLQDYNSTKYKYENIEFLTLNAVEDILPEGDVLIIRQVLQHLSNEQINNLIKKCHKYKTWIITEHVPSSKIFIPNLDMMPGSGIRLLKKSGVVLTEDPFNVKYDLVNNICELNQLGGVIRTSVYKNRL